MHPISGIVFTQNSLFCGISSKTKIKNRNALYIKHKYYMLFIASTFIAQELTLRLTNHVNMRPLLTCIAFVEDRRDIVSQLDRRNLDIVGRLEGDLNEKLFDLYQTDFKQKLHYRCL